MPRELKLATRELGQLELYVIYSKSGVWEPAWVPAQGLPFADSLTVTTKVVFDHALRGWTSPLVKVLNVAPKGALRKLPALSQQCHAREKCPMYSRAECAPQAKKMPWCFEPGGLETDDERRLLADAIRMWRAGVYIVVVDEP